VTDRRRLNVTVISVASEVWGSERSILGLAPLLAERGVDLTVAAPPTGDFATQARRAGLPVVALDLPAHAGLVNARPSVFATLGNAGRELPRVLRGARLVVRATATADVVHCNSLLATVDCALAGRRHGRPTLIEIHDLVRPGASRWALSASLRLAHAGVAISTPVAANVERWAASRVQLVPQAVDLLLYSPGPGSTEVRAELSGHPSEPVVAIIGRTDPEKGVPKVVEAVAELNRCGLHCSLVVVGAPSDGHAAYARETQRAAERQLGTRVRFVGRRSDIAAVLRSVDVVVNASTAEPFGLSILEAQACGTPVVAGAGGGLSDFVVEGVTGRLFDPGDPAALQKALHDTFESSLTTRSMAATAATRARERHSLAKRADQLTGLYRRLADEHRWGIAARLPRWGQ
jgi:glycosyltransferase involved in cell wall biosynthesis